jgi:hypothetical protein
MFGRHGATRSFVKLSLTSFYLGFCHVRPHRATVRNSMAWRGSGFESPQLHQEIAGQRLIVLPHRVTCRCWLTLPVAGRAYLSAARPGLFRLPQHPLLFQGLAGDGGRGAAAEQPVGRDADQRHADAGSPISDHGTQPNVCVRLEHAHAAAARHAVTVPSAAPGSPIPAVTCGCASSAEASRSPRKHTPLEGVRAGLFRGWAG